MGDTRLCGNFIKAFTDTMQDGFVPNQFYLWSSISLIASVLERKVWIPWGKDKFYPNMYIFLVSKPGIGKSSAMRPVQSLLYRMNESYGTAIRILPNKVTEPVLFDLLKEKEYFQYNNTQYPHTSALFYASEASTCFNDPYGGFAQTITALYDGDTISKSTVYRGTVMVENPCLNLLAGCTFDYLNKLLTTEGIMGGFASRITYVVHNDIVQRRSVWGGEQETNVEETKLLNLTSDLYEIHRMVGPFTAEDQVKTRWQEWFDTHDMQIQQTENEKLGALMIRKSTAMRKLPMILSAAERSDRVITLSHWEAALKMMDIIESKIPGMLREGQANKVNTQVGINNVIFKHLIRAPNRTLKIQTLSQLALAEGHNVEMVAKTIGHLMVGINPILVYTPDKDSIRLTRNPDNYV